MVFNNWEIVFRIEMRCSLTLQITIKSERSIVLYIAHYYVSRYSDVKTRLFP